MEIIVVNDSRLIDPKDFARMVRAISRQTNQDLCPAWGRARVSVTATQDVPSATPTGTSVIVVYDDPDDENVEFDTNASKRRIGKVFAGPLIGMGGAVMMGHDHTDPTVSIMLSRIVIETIIDPMQNCWVDGPNTNHGASYALDVCGPVEATQYIVDRVSVANFVYPSWFGQDLECAQYDHACVTSQPFALAPGGRMLVRTAGRERVIVDETVQTIWQQMHR